MRRFITTVGLGVVAAALGTGTAFGGCPTQDYPESEGWTYTSDTLIIPAGYACSGDVRFFYRGHERTIEKSPTQTIYEGGPDVKATFTNVSTGRAITKRADGDFYDRVVNGGRDLRTVGKGRNVYFGKGVRGIIWTDGVQKLTVTQYEDPLESTITIRKIKGKSRELCKVLGLRAVEGKNVP